jgi:hypothetical protein
MATALAETELRFDVKAGPTGVLFGSVTPTDVADEIWRRHRMRVDRRKIDLPESIKRVGRYEIPIEVFADVSVTVKTLVVPEGGELPPEEEEAPPAEVEAEPASAEVEAAPASAEVEAPDAAEGAGEAAEPEPAATET